MATNAQETRDLIRILADLFKRCGETSAIITAADFRLEDEESGIAALLDSVANQHHAKLREKALRNLVAVKDAVASSGQALPHLEGLIGALWLRSLAEVNQAGADRATLHVNVTRDKPLDDTPFEVELNTIVENSFNIHEDGNRYIFKEEENPQAKLISSARNDKLFKEGQDVAHLAREVRYVIGGNADVATRFRVIVLPQYWRTEPWEKVDEADNPAHWDDRIPILVLPECPAKPDSQLGPWLRDNLQSNRNVVRFLLPLDGSTNLFADRDLLVLARCVYLAEQWKVQNPEYARLQGKYQKELRDILKARFDRFAIIANWNFQEPANCRFHVESHKAEGTKIPDAVDKHVIENLFIPEDFRELILAAAPNNESVGKLLRELKEPRPGGKDCIPWLGETLIKERIIRLCAKGLIAINVRGMEYLQAKDGEAEDAAWKRMRGKLGTGKHLDETHVLLPQNVPAAAGAGMSAGGGLAGTLFPDPSRRRTRDRSARRGTARRGFAGRRQRVRRRGRGRVGRYFRRRRRLRGRGHSRHLRVESAGENRGPRNQGRHAAQGVEREGGQAHRRTASGSAEKTARRHDLRAGRAEGAAKVSLGYEIVQELQSAPPDGAWAAIFDSAWDICRQPIDEGKAAAEVARRDRAVGDFDQYLATAGWDLWRDYEAAVPLASDTLAGWWAAQPAGRAVLVLDGLSLREVPWLLAGATKHGFWSTTRR